MSVTLGYQATATATATAEFRCVHCGHRARAEVTGVGEGVQSILNSGGTAHARARADARLDIGRTLARAKCPKCQLRDGRGVWRFFRPFVITAVLMMSIGFVLGFAPTWFDLNMRPRDKALVAWLVPALIGGTLVLIMPFQIWFRWAGLDARVRWLAERDPAASM